MYTPTFSLKMRRPATPWQGLLAFFALFVSLGVSHTAKAQANFYDDAATLTQQQSGASSATVVDYAGRRSNSHAPYSTYTRLGNNTTTGGTIAPPSLGTYDLTGTSKLTINGGSIVLQPANDGDGVPYTITNTDVRYRVYMQGATPPATFTSITLPASGTYTSGAFSGSLFQASSANNNLLAGISIGGTYVLEVAFDVAGTSTADGSNSVADPNGVYQATFYVTAPPAPTLSGTTVIIAPNAGGNTVYNVNPPNAPKFQGADLGANYDVNSGQLILNGGTATATDAGPNTVSNVTLYYRVYKAGTTPSSGFNFISLPASATSTSTQNGYTVTSRTFSTNTANINLISNLTATGTYNVDVYYLASGSNNSDPANTTTFNLTDNNNGNFYTANFTVTGTPTVTTVWTGGTNDNWFDSRNWTNGVPNRTVNAIIANLGTGNPNPYPNIYVNTTYPYNGVTIDNTTSGVAEARNLTMPGSSQTDRAILRLQVGRLDVYGDFNNPQSSYIPRDNTVTGFIGGNQTISNATIPQVVIDGGGTKFLQGPLNINQSITFVDGLLVTDITRPAISVVTLDDRTAINNNQGAQLIGETETSYLRGFMTTTRAATTLEDIYTYGNSGMQLQWHAVSYSDQTGSVVNTGGNPGKVEVTRNTVQYFNPVANTTGIRRVFGVRPGNPNATTGGLNADMAFRYLDSETKNLGTNGNLSIDENNLVLFISKNSGNTFTNLGRTSLNTTTNTLTKNGVTSFATFTLGDQTNPLPVHLVAFDAKRVNTNALITWATADETNSAGFEVQVSTDGQNYRKLSFIDSYTANSQQYQTYSYTDIESGKSGVRYYRLRQVDLDGKDAYSSVKVVSFAMAAVGTAAVSIYPNPSTSSDQTTLVVQSPVAGKGRIQVLDMTGRNIVSSDITTVAGVTEFAVPTSTELSAGIYLVKVTLPSGDVKTVRMQKR